MKLTNDVIMTVITTHGLFSYDLFDVLKQHSGNVLVCNLILQTELNIYTTQMQPTQEHVGQQTEIISYCFS